MFREFLIRQFPEDPRPYWARAAAWWEQRGDLEAAIEHALAGGLETEMLRLLRALPDEFLWARGRVRTFQRWVQALSPSTQQEALDLRLRLGRELHRAGHWEEGRAYLRQVLSDAEARGDPWLRDRARILLASALYAEGRYGESLLWSLPLRDEALPLEMRMRALKVAADACTGLARFGEARRLHREALALAEALGDPSCPIFLRHNLAVGVSLPTGRLAEARGLLAANATYYRERPAQRITHLLGWAMIDVEIGDWEHLEDLLNEIEALSREVEEGQASNDFWFWWCRGMGAIGRGRWEETGRRPRASYAGRRGWPEGIRSARWRWPKPGPGRPAGRGISPRPCGSRRRP